jgi:hypothetical protein
VLELVAVSNRATRGDRTSTSHHVDGIVHRGSPAVGNKSVNRNFVHAHAILLAFDNPPD